MNTKLIVASIFSLCMVVSMSAQKKYKSTTSPVVSKTYDGIVFTSEKSVAENIQNAAQFSYLNAALGNETLQADMASEEMITVFMPINASFDAMEEEARDAFLADVSAVNATVKRHVVPGRVDANSIKKGIEKNGGVIHYKTLSNEKISFRLNNGNLVLSDADGNKATIIAADYMHKNGFFHVVEGLLKSSSVE